MRDGEKRREVRKCNFPMSKAPLKARQRSGLTPSTYLLALASFFADISTEMLYPVLPVFLTDVLKMPVELIGLIEGLATGIQYGMQGVSGWLADQIHRPKTIALVGYTLNAIGKPVIGLAASWPLALAGRVIDRFGAGSRSTPRDALIAASVDEEHRGRAFGLEGLGDNGGAFLGPMLAILLLYTFHVGLRSIFYFAFIPGFLACLMIVFVPVRAGTRGKSERASVPPPTSRAYFSADYRKYLLVTALFGIGNSTNAFLILRTKNAGIPLFATILLYAFFNLVAALISFPAGSLSDRIGRKKLLVLCFAIFALVYLGFALSVNVAPSGLLFYFIRRLFRHLQGGREDLCHGYGAPGTPGKRHWLVLSYCRHNRFYCQYSWRLVMDQCCTIGYLSLWSNIFCHSDTSAALPCARNKELKAFSAC